MADLTRAAWTWLIGLNTLLAVPPDKKVEEEMVLKECRQGRANKVCHFAPGLVENYHQ